MEKRECQHPELIKETGPIDTGINRYRCKVCGEFLIVEFKEAKVTVQWPNE